MLPINLELAQFILVSLSLKTLLDKLQLEGFRPIASHPTTATEMKPNDSALPLTGRKKSFTSTLPALVYLFIFCSISRNAC